MDMSAQQPQHAPVRLLIAETSENAAHEYDSLLRDAGIATRLEIIDLPMASSRLADADMMLCNTALPQLAQILPQLVAQAPRLPIILVNTDEATLTCADGLDLGAADVVNKSEPNHLVLVFKRELEHVCQRLRFVQTRRSLEEAEKRCQLLLQSSKAAIAYVHEGMHIYANEGYLKLFGFEDADDLLGLPLIDLLTGESVDELKAQLKQFRRDEEETAFDFTGASTSGTSVTGNITLAAAEYEGEHCLQVTVRTEPGATQSAAAAAPAAAQDDADNAAGEQANGATDARDAAIESAEDDAIANGSAQPENTDSAHSLADFLTTTEDHLTDNSEKFRSIFVAQIDDHSQLLADFGLIGTEQACRHVAAALAAATSSPFLPISHSQWAMVVCADTRKSAMDIVDGYRETIENLLLEINEKTVRPTITLGGAILEDEGHDSISSAIEATLNAAFATMQAATEVAEGNHVELPTFETKEQEFNDEASRVLTLITEAIEAQKFVLLFQPIISLRGDSDEHYEVFLRMLNRAGEQMAPHEFLRTAIDNGVAGKIDRWVILQSIKTLSAYRSKGHNTRLTINLTSNSVADPEFIQWLAVAIKAARLPSDAVIFQITESDSANYIRQTREFVEGLKSMHCRASLSRFGLAEEPFEVLQHIPVDFVKLDGSLIKNLNDDDGIREDVTELIKQLQSQGKLTIVPMVESANVLSALWQAGANYIQGHYLQEPSTAMDYDFSTDD
jgi:PAS domain S-box-containing protein